MEGNWVLKVNTKQKMPYDLYRLLHRKSTKYRNNYCFNNYVEKYRRQELNMNAIVWNMKEQIITGRRSSPEHRLRTDAGIVIKNYRRIKLLLTTSSRSQKHRKKHPPG